MAYHTVMNAMLINAENIDAKNINIVCASDLDNGFVVKPLTRSSTAGESEVWTATAPASGDLGGCYMVMNPEIVLTDSKYLGINPNVRDYYLLATKVGNAFKVEVGDIIRITAEGLTGTQSTNTFVEAVNASFKLSWAAAATTGSTAFKLISTDYFSIPDGTIGTQRVTAFTFRCVQA